MSEKNVVIKTQKPTDDDIKMVIKAGIQHSIEQEKMAQIIVADIVNMNKQHCTTKMTRALDDIFANGEAEEIDNTKKFVKTQLQTIIKSKAVQTALLGEDIKLKSLTIKKVNNGVLDGDKCLNKDKFQDKHLGLFRVIIESKKTTPKSFDEELNKLMEKHGKHANDLISSALNWLSVEQIMEELEIKQVA
jgi:hypothetical protein